METRRTRGVTAALLALLVLPFLLSSSLAACGSGKGDAGGAETSVKLPPGMTEADLDATSTSSSAVGETAQADAGSAGPSATSRGQQNASGETAGAVTRTATLSGTEFTVVAAKRQSDNKLVSASGVREVSGDFLEVELVIKNVGGSLVDLSRFSFRLRSTAITASSYDDYYGNVTTYGGYVSRNTISAALLDYASLAQVSCTLRIGEELADVFLFFDLNPLSVSANEGFTKDGADLIIYDTESGERAEINLAGFAD